MEARVVRIDTYVPEVIISTNDHKGFRKYLDEGFFVFKRENGFCTLRKRKKILVTIEYDGKQEVVNLRKPIFDYYRKSEENKLIRIFQKDLEEGIISLEVDSKGYCSIIEK